MVIPGSKKPFCRDAAPATDIHGESGLDGTTLLPKPSVSPSSLPAMAQMHGALMACRPQTAWLVVTGPLTNAALLFACFPELVGHLKGLSVMGGAVGSGFTNANLGKPFGTSPEDMQPRIGNYTPYAEFNIWVDPESAQSVFQNSALASKTALATLDLSHQVFATAEIQNMILNGKKSSSTHPTRLRKMFYDLLTFFGQTYADTFGLVDGPPVHDPLTIAAVLATLKDPKARIDVEDTGERYKINVELQGPQTGRTRVESSTPGVTIPRKVDVVKFWEEINLCLERADEELGYIPAPQ